MMMEDYRLTVSTGDISKSLLLAQRTWHLGILTELVSSLTHPVPLIPESLLPTKLALFFQFLDHTATGNSS